MNNNLLDDDIVTIKKSELFIKIINLVPYKSLWGMSDIYSDIWDDFPEFNDILKYKVVSSFSYGVIVPELNIELNENSKKFLSSFLLKRHRIWNYIYHQMIFDRDSIYFLALENFDIVDISNKTGLTQTDVEQYKKYLVAIYRSENISE